MPGTFASVAELSGSAAGNAFVDEAVSWPRWRRRRRGERCCVRRLHISENSRMDRDSDGAAGKACYTTVE